MSLSGDLDPVETALLIGDILFQMPSNWHYKHFTQINVEVEVKKKNYQMYSRGDDCIFSHQTTSILQYINYNELQFTSVE